jgi:SAM-dependent methyltransferase
LAEPLSAKSGAVGYSSMTVQSYIQDRLRSASRSNFFRTAKQFIYSLLYAPYQMTVVRFIGWRFDRKWGVETTQIVDHPKDSCDPLRLTAVLYEPTSPQLFRKIMRSLSFLPARLSFFDVGCGKGRVLLMATKYAFRRIVGIEFAPELIAVAEDNVMRFQARHLGATKIEVIGMDATQHEFPDEDSVIFLANPFTEEIMVKVLENIRRSARMTKRRYIIYSNAVLAHLLSNPKEFSLIVKDRRFSIYQMIF